MSKEGELIKIQFKNKHHEELEKTKNYKTIEFDLFPVLFEENYERTENYKKNDDYTIIIDKFPSESNYRNYKNTCCTNINKYCFRHHYSICPCYSFSSSSFLLYYELEKEEIIKIIQKLKEILENLLFLNNFSNDKIIIGDFSEFIERCGFIESITFKYHNYDYCVFNCNVKISEFYFSKKAFTKNKIVCKKLLEKGFKEKNFSKYFNYIDDYFSCLLETVFGSCSGKIVLGPYSHHNYIKNNKSIKAYDQNQYMRNLILIKTYEKHYHYESSDDNESSDDIILTFEKIGFIFRNDNKKRKSKVMKVNLV